MDDFNDDEWAEMQEMYINFTFKELKNLKKGLRIENMEALQTFGHNIKGSGGMYGFDEITRLGAEIESLAKESELEGIVKSLQNLETFLNSKIEP